MENVEGLFLFKCTRNKNYFIDNKCTQICYISHMENCVNGFPIYILILTMTMNNSKN